MRYPVGALDVYTLYSFRVVAYTRIGDGPSSAVVYIRTGETAPTGAPQNLRFISADITSVSFDWDAPLLAQQNGIIVNYTVSYRRSPTMDAMYDNVSDSIKTVDVLGRNFSLTGLESFVIYDVTVRAATRVGAGPASLLVSMKTLESVPEGPPSSMTTSVLNSTGLRVTWGDVRPRDQHGVIVGYRVVATRAADVTSCSSVVCVASDQCHAIGS